MKSSEIYLLIVADYQGRLSAVQEKQLSDWRNLAPENQQLYADLLEILEKASEPGMPVVPDVRQAWEELRKNLKIGDSGKVLKMSNVRPSAPTKAKWIYGIAASLLFLVSIFWIWQSDTPVFEVIAGNGEIQETELPDGSIVIVNSGSILRYTSAANSGERVVDLQGEAYFDVVSDPQRPFLVRTAEAWSKVVGTAFNIRSREGQTQLTVVEGKVSFFGQNENSGSLLLTGGMASNCQAGASPGAAYPVNSEWRTGWIRHQLHFDRTPLKSIAAELERHYNLQIQLDSRISLTQTFSGSFDRQPLEEVLTAICAAADLQYTLSDKRVEISPRE